MSSTNNTNMSIPLNNNNEELDGAPNMAQSTSNAITNTLEQVSFIHTPSASTQNLNTIVCTNMEEFKQKIESHLFVVRIPDGVKDIPDGAFKCGDAMHCEIIQEQEDQYTCPCGAGCSEYDNEEDICANGCCMYCGGDDFESSGVTFAHYTNEEVTSYKIDYVGDGDKDVCTRINCCGYQTHGRNNDCLGLLCSYESSKKEEADKEQLRKHCLGDGEVWAAPYRLFWPTDDGKWEEDSIVAQRLAKQKHPKRFKSRHV